jgi:hypothetical protein
LGLELSNGGWNVEKNYRPDGSGSNFNKMTVTAAG